MTRGLSFPEAKISLANDELQSRPTRVSNFDEESNFFTEQTHSPLHAARSLERDPSFLDMSSIHQDPISLMELDSAEPLREELKVENSQKPITSMTSP